MVLNSVCKVTYLFATFQSHYRLKAVFYRQAAFKYYIIIKIPQNLIFCGINRGPTWNRTKHLLIMSQLL